MSRLRRGAVAGVPTMPSALSQPVPVPGQLPTTGFFLFVVSAATSWLALTERQEQATLIELEMFQLKFTFFWRQGIPRQPAGQSADD